MDIFSGTEGGFYDFVGDVLFWLFGIDQLGLFNLHLESIIAILSDENFINKVEKVKWVNDSDYRRISSKIDYDKY